MPGAQPINDWSLFKRAQHGIAYLPQSPSLFGELTVYENLVAALEICQPERKAEYSRLIQDKIDYFELQAFAHTN